jgi:hypothetical protein
MLCNMKITAELQKRYIQSYSDVCLIFHVTFLEQESGILHLKVGHKTYTIQEHVLYHMVPELYRQR